MTDSAEYRGRARFVRAVVTVWLAASVFLTPAPASELADRLSQHWRWREIDVDFTDFAPTQVVGAGADVAIIVAGDRVASFDGADFKLSDEPLAEPVSEVCVAGRRLIARTTKKLLRLSWPGAGAPPPVVVHESAEGTSIQDLVALSDGRVAFAEGDGVFALDANDSIQSLGVPSPRMKILAVGQDASGVIWAVTSAGLFRSTEERWVRADLPRDEVSVGTLTHVVSAGRRLTFLPSTERVEKLGVAWNGARLVGIETDEFDVACSPTAVGDQLVTSTWFGRLVVRSDEAEEIAAPAALQGLRVRSLAWLETGRLLAVTARGRLFSCDVRSERWTAYRARDTGPWSIINAITPAEDGGLWVGTSAGLARFHEDGRFDVVAERVGTERLHPITALATDRDGGVWIGSGSGFRGAIRLKGSAFELHREPEGVSDAFVHAIRRGHDGALWFALIDNFRQPEQSGGLAVLRDGEWTRYDRDDGLPSNRCYDVLDSERWIVAATSTGAARLENGRWTRLSRDGAPRRVFRLFEARDGTLWSGKGHGSRRVSCFDEGSWSMSKSAGLSKITATDFAESEDGRLWITNDQGLFVYDGELLHEIGEESGAPGVGFWPIHRAANGDLWVGSLGRGLLRFRPDDRAAPVVSELRIQEDVGGPVARWNARDPWSMTPSARLRFRVRVAGGEWRGLRSTPEQTLTDVGPGESVEVQAIDMAGNRSTPRSVIYTPLPDPYATARRAATIGVALAGLLVLAMEIRRRRERRRVRVLARRRLEESERRYRAMVENADVVLSSYDVDGALTYISPQLADRVGVDADALTAATMADHVHSSDAPALEEQRARRERGEGLTHGVEFRLRDPAGGWRWLWQVQSARLAADGSLDGFDTVAIDVTERRKLQEALVNAQKLESLGVMAGGVAHDFNNLLVGVIGNAEVLRRRVDHDEELLAIIDQIELAGREAGTLCRRMLAYAGSTRLDFESIDLTALVTDSLELLRATIPSNVSLRVAPGEACMIDGDTTQLRQVILNLAINAAEAIGDATGEVAIELHRESGTKTRPEFSIGEVTGSTDAVVLSIRDDGEGMDAETRARIFDPFFSTKFEGRGLGLAAVGGIIGGHRGAIAVDSTTGVGTSFQIWFPALDSVATRDDANEPRAATVAGRHVLIVDDDRAVSGVVAQMLENLGAEVAVADGAIEALATWRRDRAEIDVVLLDLTMPDGDGVDVLRTMRSEDPRVNVILTTGFSKVETQRRCAELDPDGFLAKPYSSDALEREMLMVLGNARELRGTA